MKSNIFILFVFLLPIFSCKSSKAMFHPDTTKKDYINFGTGGGFTGKVLQYYLTKDGTIYTQNGENYEKVGKVNTALTEQVFSSYEILGMHQMKLHEPGNKYSFITRNMSGVKTSIMWGKQALSDKNVDTYFAILMNAVKKLKNKE